MVRMYKLSGRAFAKLRWKRLRGAKGSKEEAKKGRKISGARHFPFLQGLVWDGRDRAVVLRIVPH